MNKRTEQFSNLIYIIIGVFLAVVMSGAARSPYNETGVLLGLNFNLVTYIAALAAAFVLWLALMGVSALLSGRGKDDGGEEDRSRTPRSRALDAVLYLIYGAAAAAVLLLIYEIYINENNLWPGTASATFLRQKLNHRYYFAMIVLVAGVLMLTLRRLSESGRNLPFRIGTAGILALVNALATWCPNIFQDNGAGAPHIHAVLNSIVNVAHFQPYSELNCSIYGHYGLIFMPFVKILGNDLTAIMLCISAFTFVTFFLAFYVADRLTEHDGVYLIAILAITGTTTIFTRRGQYYQINPLRLLFPVVMLAVLVFESLETSSKKLIAVHIAEYAVGVLSVVWNLETGLFCVAVCAATRVFRSLYGRKLLSGKTVLTLLHAVLYAAVSIIGAYAVVNLYNILCGGTVNSVRLFVYPLFSGTYDVDNLRVPLPSVQFLYFFQIVLFLVTALLMIERQRRQTEDSEAIGTIRFATALSGLSSLVYFMNRAAYSNMSIAHIQMILLLVSYGQYALDFTRGNLRAKFGTPSAFLRSSLSALLFGGAVWMAVEGAMHIEVCYDYRSTSAWDKTSYVVGLEELNTRIPKNTFGFGYCVPEVWYQLGWDNICFMTDWSDINDYNLEYALREAVKHDAFVTTCKNQKFKGYKITDTITIGPYDFRLYEKTKNKPKKKT